MSHVDIQFTNNYTKNKLNGEKEEKKIKVKISSNWRHFSNLSDWRRADRGASHYKSTMKLVL